MARRCTRWPRASNPLSDCRLQIANLGSLICNLQSAIYNFGADMQLNLKDKVALVTGGARGIGRAIAISLASSGATVVVNYKGNQAAADEVVQAIAGDDGQALAIQADISQSAEVERLFKAVLERYGKIDILVNNAGITRDNLLLRMKEDDFNAVIGTNLNGVFLCTKAALRPMTKARSGRIINITSV